MTAVMLEGILMTKPDEETFDVRKLERFLSEEILTQAQVDEHLAGLEDCADNAEISNVHMTTSRTGRRFVSSEEETRDDEEG